MNPVIFLWAHPRSMSTAIERVMRERGDFDCLHEPFLRYYYLERSAKQLLYFDTAEDHPTSYAATRDMILARAQRGPVFAKDMSYYIMPEMLEDPEFCECVRHCFLIRNPMRAIMSYYRLDNDVDLYEIGIEAQWQQLEGLQQQGITDSVVLEAEAVQSDTAGSMGRFWQALGLEYSDQALNWQQDSIPQDWNYVQGWHQSVSDSQGIRAAAANEAEQAAAEFAELCVEAPQLSGYLEHHLPFYERLRALSLTREADE
jgi:hypothetical protein